MYIERIDILRHTATYTTINQIGHPEDTIC